MKTVGLILLLQQHSDIGYFQENIPLKCLNIKFHGMARQLFDQVRQKYQSKDTNSVSLDISSVFHI